MGAALVAQAMNGGDASMRYKAMQAEKDWDCVSSRGFEQKEHRKLSSLSIGSAHAF